MLTLSELEQITHPYSSKCAAWIGPITDVLVKYDISNPKRIAAYLSQTIAETGCYTLVTENLNYSATELVKVFPSHFTTSEAESYQHQPEKIASRVYGDLFGNGPESSGDGWTYRGRGLIQITFRDNYLWVAKALGKSLEDTVTYLSTPEGAAISSGLFWNKHDLNTLADQNKIQEISLVVHGSTTGISTRVAYYSKAISILGA